MLLKGKHQGPYFILSGNGQWNKVWIRAFLSWFSPLITKDKIKQWKCIADVLNENIFYLHFPCCRQWLHWRSTLFILIIQSAKSWYDHRWTEDKINCYPKNHLLSVTSATTVIIIVIGSFNPLSCVLQKNICTGNCVCVVDNFYAWKCMCERADVSVCKLQHWSTRLQ